MTRTATTHNGRDLLQIRTKHVNAVVLTHYQDWAIKEQREATWVEEPGLCRRIPVHPSPPQPGPHFLQVHTEDANVVVHEVSDQHTVVRQHQPALRIAEVCLRARPVLVPRCTSAGQCRDLLELRA